MISSRGCAGSIYSFRGIVTGHLQIELAADAARRTYISKQSFHAPMHLSKPHWDGNCLIVQAVNCTAGLFSGDRIDVSVHALPGSRSLITSPSAQRAYQARDPAAFAEIEQSFRVEAGAWLEVCPEVFIPQRGARVRQRTRIDLESDASLLFIESLAPGRVGSAESYAFEILDWSTDLCVDGILLSRERYRLSPTESGIQTLRSYFPDAYYASCYLAAPGLSDLGDLRQGVLALSGEGLELTASFLAPNIATLKLLARGSLEMRAGLLALREYCYSVLGRPLPAWRKL